MPQRSDISIQVSNAPAKSRNANPHKRSVYLNESIWAEMKAEGGRIDRGVSWLIQEAWRVAYDQIRAAPSARQR